MRRCFLSSFLGLLVLLLPAFTQSPAAIVEGLVINAATNAPIALARVKLSIVNSGIDPVYAMTDKEGHFTIRELARSNYGYQLTAERPGFIRADTSQGETQQAVVTHPNRPAPQDGETPQPANRILLLPYAAISGRITDPNGAPMVQVPVTVSLGEPREGQSGGRRWDDRTNDVGEYRVAFLKPGTYYVVAARASNPAATWESSYHQTFFPAALDAAGAKGLEVAAGQEARANIQIIRLSGGRVAGRIHALPTDKTTEALRHTWIELKPSTQSAAPDAKYAQSEGDAFEFTQVPPGNYTLTAATVEQPATSRALEDGKSVLGVRTEITVTQSGLEGIQLEMQPLPDIHGKVVFGAGCSAPVRIDVAFAGPAVPKGVTTMADEDGTFVLTGLNPGRLTLHVSWTKVAFKVMGIRLGDSEILDSGFDYPLASPAPNREANFAWMAPAELQVAVDCLPRKR